MFTYQDLQRYSDKKEFIARAINEHKMTAKYRNAKAAEQYYAKKNVTISNFQKFLRTLSGGKVEDTFCANYKLKTLFFRRFVTQQVQYVLGNGIEWQNDGTKEKLGDSFDTRVQQLAKKAMIDGVAFAFWNYDHLEIFSFCDTETDAGFIPFYDETTGELMAGVRYWHLGTDKKRITRATLYEPDGYTDYKRMNDGDFEAISEKTAFYSVTRSVQGEEVTTFMNYASFPIVPMYANDVHESELVGIRESIDCYDFIKSGIANDIDDSSGFYWVLKNSGGMDDIDLAQFIERMKTVRAAAVDSDDGVSAEAHTLSVPIDAQSRMLDIIRKDLYDDFQLLDISTISAGNKTATEIRAAYQAQDDKCAGFEYELIETLLRVLRVAGIDDFPVFHWNKIVNEQELVNSILAAAAYLDERTVLKKLPFIDTDEIDGILEAKAANAMNRYLA